MAHKRTPEQKVARLESDRKWRAAHAEEYRRRDREYRAKNLQKIRENYAKNRAKHIKAAADWVANHPEQRRETKRKYREANRESISAYNRQYREKNRENIMAKEAARIAQDPEKEREQRRKNHVAWRSAHPEERAQTAEWRKANPEKVKESYRKWCADHPETVLQYARNRRAYRAASSGHHTPADIARLFDLQGGKCATCLLAVAKKGKGKYHIDHVMPLKRGGSDGPENLQLLCRPCNIRKKDKHPDDWAKAHGRLFV